MDFVNVTGDVELGLALYWDRGDGDRRSCALGHFRIVDRRRVIEAIRRTTDPFRGFSRSRRASRRRWELSVQRGSHPHHGSYSRRQKRRGAGGRQSRRPRRGHFRASGSRGRTVFKGSRVCGGHHREGRRSHETPSLEAYRAFTEGWLQLETLDIREIPQAVANFQRAISSRLSIRARVHRPCNARNWRLTKRPGQVCAGA